MKTLKESRYIRLKNLFIRMLYYMVYKKFNYIDCGSSLKDSLTI